MSESLNPRVEELFKLYRNNFDVLDTQYKLKGTGLGFGSVKVGGEEFQRYAYFDQEYDLTVHSCGLSAFPEHLTSPFPDGPLGTYEFKKSQENELQQIFNKFEINFDYFGEAVQVAKGFWIEYLQTKKWDEYFKQSPRPSTSSINFSGSLGDVLGIIIPDYASVVTELSQNRTFKKIEGADRPINRQSAISDYFLRLFMDKHYSCSHFELTECTICKRMFYPQCDREWVTRVPPIFCQLCLQMGFSASTDFFRKIGFSMQQRKENYLEGVRIYVDYFGFIPPVGYQKRKAIKQLNQTGVSIDELVYAIKVSSLLPWTESATEMFGSWAHFLEEAGLLSQRQRGRGGHQSIASDGHLCLSMGERAVCEFLHTNGIEHSREPMYPFDEKLNPNHSLRGDFQVGELFIEFAGMMSNPDYSSRMKDKSKLAKKYGIPWIKLETAKLEELREILFLIEGKRTTK